MRMVVVRRKISVEQGAQRLFDEMRYFFYLTNDRATFAAQFAGKDVRDPFKVGEDIEAISRATITINSATRAIRNGARRFARQVLTAPPQR